LAFNFPISETALNGASRNNHNFKWKYFEMLGFLHLLTEHINILSDVLFIDLLGLNQRNENNDTMVYLINNHTCFSILCYKTQQRVITI